MLVAGHAWVRSAPWIAAQYRRDNKYKNQVQPAVEESSTRASAVLLKCTCKVLRGEKKPQMNTSK